MNNKIYDLLKWVAITCLPALKIAIPPLFEVWGWSYGNEIGKTLDIVAVLLATLLGVSTINYYKAQNEIVDKNVEAKG